MRGTFTIASSWEQLTAIYPAYEKQKLPQIVWFGHRTEDAAALGALAEIAGIISCDWGLALSGILARLPVFSQERRSGIRRQWSSSDLAQIPVIEIAELLALAARRGEYAIAPYKASRQLDEIATHLSPSKPIILAPPPDLIERLDDKGFQRKCFASWGIQTPRWRLLSSNLPPEALDWIFRNLPVVVQPRRGSLGIGVKIIQDEHAARTLVSGMGSNEALLVSSFLEGVSLNTTAVVTREKIHLAWPSVQISGARPRPSPDFPFLFAGSDFGAVSALEPRDIRALMQATATLGEKLRDLGYLGIFGADWILAKEGLYLLEINPRMQGSTALLTELELKAGAISTLYRHAAVFLRGSGSGGTARDLSPLAGSQILIHALYRDAEDKAGVPSLPDRPASRFLPPQWTEFTNRLQAPIIPPGCWRLQNLPMPGTRVTNGSLFGRLVGDRSVLGPDLRTISSSITEMLAKIDGQLQAHLRV